MIDLVSDDWTLIIMVKTRVINARYSNEEILGQARGADRLKNYK
jgi:hypothetical protein